MKTWTVILWVVSVNVACSVAAAQSADDPDVLMQAGKVKELVDGDLQAAIKVYGSIIDRHGNNRPIAAEALLHIGQCYEKLGRDEARKAYQRIIEDYPDQSASVSEARARLTALRQDVKEPEPEARFRRIQIASKPDNGVLSPDGSQLTFASEGALWILPVHGNVDPDIAGEPVRLTESMNVWNMGNSLSWSADGKWIAFNTLNPRTGEPRAIHVISSAGGTPKRIPCDLFPVGHPFFYRLGLSPDGKTLAYSVGGGAAPGNNPEISRVYETSIFTVPVEGGEPTLLADGRCSQPAFSPDGRLVAFIKEDKLWVVSATGGTPELITETIRRRAKGPVWSPDAKMIAIVREPESDNSGTEIWIFPVSETGKAVASPTKIPLPAVSLPLPAGWTGTGQIGLFLYTPRQEAIYTVPASGGNAVQITPNGHANQPRWCPDGDCIVFRGLGLFSVPAEGGEVTPILSHENRVIWPAVPGGGCHVSPDGNTILYSDGSIRTVPMQGGQSTRMTSNAVGDRFPCWSPDGESIAFLRLREMPNREYGIGIWVVPARGGQPQPLTSESIWKVPTDGGAATLLTAAEDQVSMAAIAYSPDGKWLAYFSQESLKVMPAEGGPSRYVTKVHVVNEHRELCWSPDSKQIAFTDRGGGIWLVPLEGGPAKEVKTGVLTNNAMNVHIDWSPSGQKLVFSATVEGWEPELWLMEDFLPLVEHSQE